MRGVVVVLCLALAGTALACVTSADCSSHGLCRSGGCVCFEGWGGETCASTTNDCTSHCFGQGTCLDGKCTCDLGYTGDLCNIVVEACPQNCSGHGTCQDGRCHCKGLWKGDACDEEIFLCPTALNNCTGRGICQPSLTSSLWECSCRTGFCGEACNVACPKCDNNCTGRGFCDGNTCICDFGFTGSDCSRVLGVCPHNCSGRGQCILPATSTHPSNSSRNVPYCQCIDGYFGEACDTALTDTVNCIRNCSGKGACVAGACKCLDGYYGAGCEQALGACEVMNRCSGNGLCINGTCSCYQGYSGFDCTISCRSDFAGDVGCNFDHGRRGRCVNGTCVCKPEWTGMWCDQSNDENMLKSYSSGWNPLGTFVLASVGALALVGIAMFVYNKFFHRKTGLSTVPAMDDLKSRLIVNAD